jgi:hypothetical protein
MRVTIYFTYENCIGVFWSYTYWWLFGKNRKAWTVAIDKVVDTQT